MQLKCVAILLTALLVASCGTGGKSTSLGDQSPSGSGIVEVTFLQLNDVYEIAPVEGGKYGGMARVASVRRELAKENPNTYAFLAGDFISPSAIGTSVWQGKRINGAQMVDAMNAAGVDYVTFGNHEFDLGEEVLLDRMNQSDFTWISSNIKHVLQGRSRPFEKTRSAGKEPQPGTYIITAKNTAGREVRIGVIGLTIGSNTPAYMEWSDPFETAQRAYRALQGQTDFVIALTHLSIEEDRKLAGLVPDLKLILGGHEHTNMLYKVGGTLIAKADANARTVYIHKLKWDPATKAVTIMSELRTIDASIPEEPGAASMINEWLARAYEGFRQKGFNPSEVIATLDTPLDGRESSIRHQQTNLGAMVANAMLSVSQHSQIAVFNSGSIRLDDELSGVTTQYDIIRTLPFGGKLVEVQIRGTLLTQLLDAGADNVGRGGYLQYSGVAWDTSAGRWRADGNLVDPQKEYNVIVSDFLFSGRETNIEFFNRGNEAVLHVTELDARDVQDLRRDIRLAVIAYLKSGKH